MNRLLPSCKLHKVTKIYIKHSFNAVVHSQKSTGVGQLFKLSWQTLSVLRALRYTCSWVNVWFILTISHTWTLAKACPNLARCIFFNFTRAAQNKVADAISRAEGRISSTGSTSHCRIHHCNHTPLAGANQSRSGRPQSSGWYHGSSRSLAGHVSRAKWKF